MKKKIVTMLLLLSVSVLTLGGCGNKDNAKTESSSTASTSTSSASASSAESSSSTSSEEYVSPTDVDGIPVVDEDAAVSDCLTLGDYKGLTLEKKVEQVTDEEVDESIKNAATITVEDPDATVQEGDTVDIAYVGKIDGEEFDGGSSDSTNLTIGSGQFIDGFEDGCIGMKQDETKDLNLKFPDNYGSTDLAGKDVVFTVTINAIMRPASNVDGWELNDEWVKANTDYSTVDEYLTEKRNEMEAANETTAESNLQADLLQALQDCAEIKKIPRSYITLGEKDYDTQYENYVTGYGITLDDFLENYADRAAYNEQKATYAKSFAKAALVADAVKEAEGWTTEDQEYQDLLNEEATNANASTEDLINYWGEETVERNIMLERVLNLIRNEGTITTVTVDADGNTVE